MRAHNEIKLENLRKRRNVFPFPCPEITATPRKNRGRNIQIEFQIHAGPPPKGRKRGKKLIPCNYGTFERGGGEREKSGKTQFFFATVGHSLKPPSVCVKAKKKKSKRD